MSKQTEEFQKREQFIDLARHVFPLIQQMEKVLEESEFGTSASITMGSDGYLEFQPYNTRWRMVRYKPSDSPAARYDFSEPIIITEEGK